MIVAMEFEVLYGKSRSHIDQGIVELRLRNFAAMAVSARQNFMKYLEMSTVLVELKAIGVVRK